MVDFTRREVALMCMSAPIILAAAAVPSPAISAEPAMALGMCIDVSRASKTNVDKALDACKDAGVTMVRWDAQWSFVERAKGVLRVPPLWDYAVARGLSLGINSLIILDYGNPNYDNGDKPLSEEAMAAYVNYARFLVAHFKGRVKYYEIWNEWDGKVGKTTPGKSNDYARLIRATYPAIKAEDPDCVAMAGGLTNWALDSLTGFGKGDDEFEQLLATNVLAEVDAISIHPYVAKRTRSQSTLEAFDYQLTTVVEHIRTTPGLKDKPIYITELGWTTSQDGRFGVSEDVQTDYLIGAIKRSRALGIHTLFVFAISDGRGGPMDPEANFGVVRQDWTPKPAYAALVQREYER